MSNLEYSSVIERTKAAAKFYGVELEPVGANSPPDTFDELVSDLINLEYIAKDVETGESARGESMNAAWANLRGISKMEVHDKCARWNNDQ